MDKKLLKNLPKSPGIYKFFDKNENILYIGKSVNLNNRVKSYFNGIAKLNFAKRKMVEQIKNLEVILTNTEEESLILETNLIKKHKPKYNILMKDDKNHVYLKITNEVIPRLIKTRIKGKTGEYFGPYVSTNYVKSLLKITKKVFGHRSCQLGFEKKTETREIFLRSTGNIKIPCMDYYLGTCSAPCLLEKSKIKEYQKNIENIREFLRGNSASIINALQEKMLSHAKKLEFEQASQIKEDIEAIRRLSGTQLARDFVDGDYDIVNLIEKYGKFYVGKMLIRDGKIVGYYNYKLENKLEESKQEILIFFLEQQYSEENNKNIRILAPFETDILIPNKIEIPKIGGKVEILKLVYKNILEYSQKNHLESLSTKSFTKQTMKNLLKILGYNELNKDMIFECNDISHLAGTHTVASRSVIENGKLNPKKYKKFRIKTLEKDKIDDFASMSEIMTRRLLEIEKTQLIPDLIVIDGGKWQLSSVVKILENKKTTAQGEFLENLKKIQLVSIAKREEELFLPWKSESIILEKDSQELRMIQKIRDESHRFAITFNRDSRIKSMKKNILEEIPGIGPKTRKKIFSHFGSIENFTTAPYDKIEKILPKSQIQTLKDHGIL